MLFNLLDLPHGTDPKSTGTAFPPLSVHVLLRARAHEGQGQPKKVTAKSSSAKQDEKLDHKPRSFTSAAHSCAQIEGTNPYTSALL